MRKLQSILLFTLFTGYLSTNAVAGTPVPPGKQKLTSGYVIGILTKHQWTIAEYKEKINDTLRNTTLLMMPCEKDQVLQYQENNTYRISEGVTKCTGDPIKGEGTWQYEETDSTLSEKYTGGSMISKTVRYLDDGMFKIEYEGEGKRIISITYLSEAGKKDDSKKDQFVDNTDPASYIAQVIRQSLIEEGSYKIVPVAEFKGNNVAKTSSLKVVVYPVWDQVADPAIDVNDNNNNLMQAGKAAGVDYIVTGSLVKLVKSVGEDKKPLTSLKYNIYILNIKKEKRKDPNSFAYPEDNSGGRRVEGLIRGLHHWLPYVPVPWIIGPLAGNNSHALWRLYHLSYAASRANSAAYYGATVYSNNISAQERENHFQSSVSVLEAIEGTQKDLAGYLKKNLK